jgi:hypothetical protein
MPDRKLPVIQGDYCYRIKAACPEQRGADTVLIGRLQHRVKQLRNALAWIWTDPPPPPTCATCEWKALKAQEDADELASRGNSAEHETRGAK